MMTLLLKPVEAMLHRVVDYAAIRFVAEKERPANRDEIIERAPQLAGESEKELQEWERNLKARLRRSI